MSRTFTPLAGTAAGSAYQVHDKFGYQSAEHVRQNLDLLAYIGAGYDLGGSEDVGIVTGAATWQPVRAYRPFTLDGDNFGGLVVEACVCYKTINAAQAVQVRLRNVTDSTTAGTGLSSTSTTTVEENVAITLASGAKKYRLEVLGGATYDVFAWGYLRIRKVPV